MVLKKRDFQKLVNFIKEFQNKLPCDETSAELRDALNLSLLHMHKYYKRVKIRCQNGGNTLEGSISLTSSLTGAASPMSPYIPPLDRFDWRWLSLDPSKLSASFGHGEMTNFVPEIFYAIKDGDMEQLKKIVDDDPDKVNELDAIGRTTAMYAANGGTPEYLEMLQFLISKEVDLQHQSNDGFTCLHIACYYGHKDFVEALLKEKVDVNVQDSDGRAPLHWAAAYWSQDLIQLLIVNGADPKIQDNEGLTAAMWACHFDQLDNLQLLFAVQEKANPAPEARYQVVDKNGRTILHWAVTKMTNISCMKYLLNAETAHLYDEEGKTIFLCAAEHGCLAACEEILDLCSDDVIEDMDNQGRTALHLASLGGHGEVVDFLLSRGAAVDRLDNQGASSLDYVCNRKLNYCNLVFTSYQRYKERLANMHAKLNSAKPEANVSGNDSLINKDAKIEENATIADENRDVEPQQRGNFHQDEKSQSSDAANKSLKIDCQDAVGFEIEGDIEEDIAEDIEFETSEGESSPVAMKDGDQKSTVRDVNKEDDKEKRQKSDPEEKSNKKVSPKDAKKNSHKKLGRANKPPAYSANETEGTKENGDRETAGGQRSGGIEEQIDFVQRPQLNTAAPVDKNDERDEEENFSVEEVSIGMEDEKIVLVAHHEGDEGFQIDYGDGNDYIDDLEFQENEAESPGFLEQEVNDKEPNISDHNDVLRVEDGVDRDLFETSRLSPRVESVTGLMETNTAPANHSVSVNMSVSSLRSDSEDEEEIDAGKERISKLDSKLPLQTFEERPVNQLEYRDPFARPKPLPKFDDTAPHLKRSEENRPKTSHAKRKDKKGGHKEKQLSPKGKSNQNSPKLPIGALEPMKPLQPIMPPHGFAGSRSIGGSQGGFPGKAYDSMLPISPRASHDRANALSSPVESPRSKGSPQSPRFGFDGRERISHIPRPNSPSTKEKHLASNNIFAPRPPFGR
eukprot:Seg1647.7 transcript_id=Seg1647.7/GoldUCD/mRNA.D3Y31 product="Ankyrin repeat domain-containing protein 55" protein_id=Seg1647.7/GoldUCD/D3Y31